ncbi:CFC_HP_G0056010.mRNA.1.CDS.1 [Saccharomyces cerevisiae]|nr:CFC_HP_G0053420.mRNA.1.CDS.1 [Saccharomyces cerevisiae]CAI4938828.1 CFC_HP_G0056010.mRNA.1.CDS.1 [Saccharomyces cerevisiae]CAI6506101.1 CFC_HP_G0053420.mRNA.1.CDS.1 [Saccharomyces cerevisiae]CAI6529529.1 CFC_HP_G0056010.mRNA.1.CDS.1 [Saccharomyces cerevisiae]CAI6655729.1 AAC_collapsed_G0018180.mRNA.1.CDS.1 [Saccharomyces cerevisiae]
MDINELIIGAQSADKHTREVAETQLLQWCDSDASQVFKALANVALQHEASLESRQFALLSLRKLITMYWSPGFESYRSTSNVEIDVKDFIREVLLKLCLNDNENTKIKNGASYCIVQISAVDFPDQWPQLLTVIYDAISHQHSLNAMSLLNEIYDDVVSEEMFFEGGIGLATMEIVFKVLNTETSTLIAKIAALKLLKACLLQMSSHNEYDEASRKSFVSQCLATSLQILGQLLTLNFGNVDVISQLKFKSIIYENLVFIKNDFSRKHFSSELQKQFKIMAIQDLENVTHINANVETTESEPLLETVHDCSIYIVEFLTSVCTLQFSVEEMNKIITSLTILCQLSSETREIWTSDFNTFVSKETGLAASYNVRDQANEFFTSLPNPQLSLIFKVVSNDIEHSTCNYSTLESLLYLLQCILLNDDEITGENIDQSLQILIKTLENILVSQEIPELILARAILTIPRVLDKFIDALPDIKPLTSAFLAKSLNLALKSDKELIKSATLIAFTYYCYFAELDSVLGPEVCSETQEKVIRIINQVSSDAEEDTNGALMEVLSQVISYNPKEPHSRKEILQAEFHLVFTISSEDPANVQVVVQSQECLEKLLDNINMDNYKNYIELCLPSFINVLDSNNANNYRYSPLLSLVLEFITVFLNKKPNDGFLPDEINQYLFEPLAKVLAFSTEDETLQLATEAFSYLIFNTDTRAMEPRLMDIMKVLERLLSLEVSDSAAMNVGPLVVAIFTRFSKEIQPLIGRILEAVVVRLIKTQNISTEQNLLSVLCFLTCNDPKQTVDFLSSFQIDNTDALTLVMRKWIEAFEVIRGEKRIKENIVALSNLFFLNDKRLQKVVVNGDLIPYEGDLIITRSMAKKMPDRYVQVPLYTKIIKLFVSELSFQSKQPNPEQLITSDIKQEVVNANKDDDNDDWEDVDDVLDYDKLKEYIDDDVDEEADDDSDDITGLMDVKESVVQLLVRFFKEVASKDVSGFHCIYETLSDSERKVLSEALL